MASGRAQDYEVVEQIGRGAFGATYLVVHKAERKRCLSLSISSSLNLSRLLIIFFVQVRVEEDPAGKADGEIQANRSSGGKRTL